MGTTKRVGIFLLLALPVGALFLGFCWICFMEGCCSLLRSEGPEGVAAMFRRNWAEVKPMFKEWIKFGKGDGQYGY